MLATYYTWFILSSIIFGTSICVAHTSSSDPGDRTGAESAENSKIVSLCDVTVPSSVQARSDIWRASSVQARSNIWRNHQTPAEDDLDRFWTNRTGCSYKALKYYEHFSHAATTNGTLVEWRAALRGREKAMIQVWWEGIGHYSFSIGHEDNKQTYVYEHRTSKKCYLSTPDILSRERYEWFYVRIHAGTLTLGRECECEPLDTQRVSWPRAEQVEVHYLPMSLDGLKLLYDCPANVAGRERSGMCISSL